MSSMDYLPGAHSFDSFLLLGDVQLCKLYGMISSLSSHMPKAERELERDEAANKRYIYICCH